MHWADFHFIRPWWLLALVPVALLVVLLCKRRAAGSGWDGLISSSIMPRLMVGRDERLARAPIVLLGFAWLLAVTALAGPTWERQPQALYRASLDQVIVLDLSPSMTGTDIAPSRLARARFAISDVLAQTTEGRTALVVFGAEHHVVTPLTDDAATVEQLLRSLSVDVLPVAGDLAASALRAALQLLAAASSRAAHVILMSDGVGDPAESIAAAIELRGAGAKLSVIGIGIERESQLRELARSGGGAYQPLGQLGGEGRGSPALGLEAVAGFTQTPGRELTADLWAEKGAWLLLPLLLVAALGYRRGWLVVLAIALFQHPQDAMAFDWDDLWLTPNQQAKRLLESGQASQAAELFADPQWQATARYQSGEFDKAAEQFAVSNAAYNRANALARAGKLQEAIGSYDEALAAQPDDEDARFNRELLQKLLQQQQQQQQQSGDQQEPEQGQKEQEQGKEQSPQSQQQAGQQQPQNDQQPSNQSAGNQSKAQQDESQGQAGQPQDSQQESSATGDEQQDAQQQAKDDVAPQSANAPDPKQASGPVPEPEQPAQQQQQRGDSLARATTEKELALEQWLRQVPDDPGGLLRRKFMLEHLQRRKEPGTP